MTEYEATGPTITEGQLEPELIREVHYETAGSLDKSLRVTGTIPEGKFWKVVIKAIITEVTEEEYTNNIPQE